MAVYVDDFYKTGMMYRGMKMSHMMADTHLELLAMVKKINIATRHIQDEGTKKEHFDVCKVKRQLAINAGAIPIGMRELPALWQNRDMATYNWKKA